MLRAIGQTPRPPSARPLKVIRNLLRRVVPVGVPLWVCAFVPPRQSQSELDNAPAAERVKDPVVLITLAWIVGMFLVATGLILNGVN